ncbi:hypothetical protein AB3S75_041451 [Citrus x aurantiifolia]
MASANLASSSHQTQNPTANSTTVSFTFNTPVKLDQSNYLIWRSQVLASIRGNRLEKFIDDLVTPPSSHIAQRVNDELRGGKSRIHNMEISRPGAAWMAALFNE